jgi:hypothetical protein
MRTTLNSRRASWRRAIAAVAVTAMPLGIIAVTGGVASAHEAPGSPVEVFVDTTGSADVNDSIQAGWWGHEGGASDGTGTQTSFLDLNGSDPDLSVFSNLANIRVAFVATSADGSAEHPAVSAGQSVDQVFTWFMDAGLQTGLNGNTNPNDSVNIVSTGAEYNAWFSAGQPVQGFNNNLQVLDVTAPGTPVSATPQGKSILNRWPAGTDVSLVFYESTGATSPTNGLPIVKVGSDGHAVTSYMPFTTAQKPGDAVRTSAGYNDVAFGAIAQATHTTLATSVSSPQGAGTPVDLTATVAVNSGSDVPVGSVEFFDGATSLGAGNLNASGVAHLNGVGLSVGSHSLTAVYAPTNTQALAFDASTSSAVPFEINGIGTSTAAGATPGADVTAPVDLTATVTPAGVAGTVIWKDGPTTIEGPTPVDASGLATVSHTFAVAGSHTVTAFFTPTSGNYGPSQGSVSFSLAAPSGVSTAESTITATVPSGTLTVTTPYGPGNPLDVGTLALTGGLDGYQGSVQFDGIHVVDTRDGAQPWALTALAGDLADGGGHFINGQNVGLTDLVAEAASNPGLGTITTSENAVPAAPLAPGAPGSAGLGGIAHTVLSADQGPSDVLYHGTLTVFAPTTTPTGTYTGTITFTAS